MTEQTSRSSSQEIDTRFSLDCENTNLSVERLDKDKDTDKDTDINADRDRTGRPVVDIDFRVSGLPHAVVKQAENLSVRELVKKIESHPHRQDLQADLQQSNAFNPFSGKSKKMTRDMGNSELFELCETIPKVQCSECLLYWNQGIVYCTCGHLLREKNPADVSFDGQLDLLSIQNYVIKKGRPHGNRHGQTEEQRKHFIAHNFRKRCIKKGFLRNSRSFSKDLTFRDSQLRIDRTEKICIQMGEDAQNYVTYRMSSDENFRYTKNWWISLNTSGRNAPMKLRSNFSEALTKLHRFHHESGEERLAPIPFLHYQKWHPSSSSSSTSWWQWNDSWWSS